VPFNFTLTATGSPQIDFSIPNLPDGLSVDVDKIVGTSTTAGTYNVFVTATNDAGSDIKPLQLVINPAPPIITAVNITGSDGVPLVPYTLQVTGASPISFSAVGLPIGNHHQPHHRRHLRHPDLARQHHRDHYPPPTPAATARS